MKIYMYNTWFGDCFRIEKNQDDNLIVDFGIRSNCLSKPVLIRRKRYSSVMVDRNVVFKDISNEFSKLPKLPNLLLTHYHEDHFSGLLYMKNKKLTSPVFGRVYLPDIWNVPDSKDIVSLLLIENLMANSLLDSKGCSLLELVRFLCLDVKNVTFLKRNDKFENGYYTALWPDMKCMGKRIHRAINGLDDILRQMEPIAIKLIEIMLRLETPDDISLDSNIYEAELNQLALALGNINLPDLDNWDKLRLNSLGNDISIVFHNTEELNSNILFTGDVNRTHMKKIDKNYDGLIELHTTYRVIKVPHHGTKTHHFDFSKFNPKFLLISNGDCRIDTHKISKLYGSDLAKIKNVQVCCSNSNFCESNIGMKFKTCSCGASKRKIIFPKMNTYISI